VKETRKPLPEPDEEDSPSHAAKYFAEAKGEQSIIFLDN
jgi:hypothetical protein